MDDWWGKNPRNDPSDVHPSGPIPKTDCLDAANNLIADLTKKNQELQEKLEGQKRKAESFENLLAEAENEIEVFKEKKDKKNPTKAISILLGITIGCFLLLLLLAVNLQQENSCLRNQVPLYRALEKSKAEAEKLSDENKKLAGEIEELKKQITPPVPVEEKKEGEVKHKKLRWYQWVFGVGCITVVCFSICAMVIFITFWIASEYEEGDFFNFVFWLILAIGGGIGSYYFLKPTPQDETVQVEQDKQEMQEIKEKTVETSKTEWQPTYAKIATILDGGHIHGYQYCYYVELAIDGKGKGHLVVNHETYYYFQHHTGPIKIYVDSDFTSDLEEKKEEPKKKRIEY